MEAKREDTATATQNWRRQKDTFDGYLNKYADRPQASEKSAAEIATLAVSCARLEKAKTKTEERQREAEADVAALDARRKETWAQLLEAVAV